MEVNITYVPEDQMVIVKTFGDADAQSSGEMIKSIFMTMQKHKCFRCLLDHTEIHFVSGKTLEVFNRPEQMKNTGMPLNVKLAAVIPPLYKDHFCFLETVCLNRGISYRVFENRNSAINWLKSS
jgi:hypothetical protein